MGKNLHVLELPLYQFSNVMKRYRQGADCSVFLDFLSDEQEWPLSRYRDFIKQSTVLCRIVDGSLLVRQKWAFLVPPKDEPSSCDYRCPICPHWGWTTSSQVGKIVKGRMVRGTLMPGKRIKRCKYCTTEVRVDFKAFGEQGSAIFLTKWQDIGEFRSPRDYPRQSFLDWRNGPTRKRISYRAGSICAAFEGGEEFRFDSLLSFDP